MTTKKVFLKMLVRAAVCVLILGMSCSALALYETDYNWYGYFEYTGYGHQEEGPYVRAVQGILNLVPGVPVTAIYDDGDWGPLTHGAAVAYQRSRGLDDDGVIGPLTWQSLQLRTTYSRNFENADYYRLKRTDSDFDSSQLSEHEYFRHRNTGQWLYYSTSNALYSLVERD